MKKFLVLNLLLIAIITSCSKHSEKNSDELSFREWYMPNGIFTSSGTTPESSSYDVTGYAQEWVTILNPSKEEAEITITFIDRHTGAKTKSKQKIGPERMFILNHVSLPPEIYSERRRISVLVESTVPVVAMQIRCFFHLKNQSPRGMIGMLAYPVGDREVLN